MSKTQHQRLPDGAQVAGRYTIEGVYGTGGFATVYKASDQVEGGRTVAIKLLHADLDDATIEESVQRFLREAKAIAQVEHPGVVSVYDVGRLADRFPYIVMEPLDGRDLSRALDEDGPIPPHRLIPMFVSCLEALAEAHEKGIVHRDLKPENLILSSAGDTLKIIDFGIVRLDKDKVTLTRTGRRVGTPRYLAPEYIKDGTVTPRVDVYQMGLSLIEGMTGRRVVTSRNPLDAALVHLAGELNIPLGLLDGPLGPVLHGALHRHADARYASAAEFVTALRAIDPAAVQVGDLTDTVCLRDHEPPPVVVGAADPAAVTAKMSRDSARGAIEAAKATIAAQSDEVDPEADTARMDRANAQDAIAEAKALRAAEAEAAHAMEDAATVKMDLEEAQRAHMGLEDAKTVQMDVDTAMSDARTVQMNPDEVPGMGRAETMASFDASRQQLDAAALKASSRDASSDKTRPLPRLSPGSGAAAPTGPITRPPRPRSAPPESQDNSSMILLFVGGGLVLGVLALFVLLIMISAPEEVTPPAPGAATAADAGASGPGGADSGGGPAVAAPDAASDSL